MPDWEGELAAACRDFDWPRLAGVTERYVQHLRSADGTTSVQEASGMLRLLREHLRYDELLRVGDALLGNGVEAPVVRRQLAQALVDRESPATSLLIFSELADDPTVPAGERVEARGGVGRCYKQLFALSSAPQVRARYLLLGLQAYRAAYEEDRSRVWHGINAVALLARAARDRLPLEGGLAAAGAAAADAAAEARVLAADILGSVEALAEPDAWATATAAEACLALDRKDEAVAWSGRFAAHSDAGAFKLASFLRQLTDVWQLDTHIPPGDRVLPVLRSALLGAAGGSVLMAGADIDAAGVAQVDDPRLEKVLGTVRYRSLTWYRSGLERCRAVARVENVNEDGIGTGFLVAGASLHPALPERVLVTNGHVVPEGIDPRDVVVVFHGLDGDAGRQRFRIARRWWYEPSQRPGLDTTLVELDGLPAEVAAAPPAHTLPNLKATDPPRAYLIGHPRGLAQPQFSLQDNVVLDHDENVLHYRSPTEPGSSGSPVFDSQWRLIGLHHAGGDLPRLHARGGSYAANEAIALPAIVAGLVRRPPAPEPVLP